MEIKKNGCIKCQKIVGCVKRQWNKYWRNIISANIIEKRTWNYTKKEAEGEIFNKEEKIKKFKELVNLIYDEKIKILKEELLKQ